MSCHVFSLFLCNICLRLFIITIMANDLGGYGRCCASRVLGVGVLRLLGDVHSAHFYGMYVCFVNICLLAER